MKNYSELCIILKRMMRNYYDAMQKKNVQEAYEIALDMTDLTQQLEDVTKGIVNGDSY